MNGFPWDPWESHGNVDKMGMEIQRNGNEGHGNGKVIPTVFKNLDI